MRNGGLKYIQYIQYSRTFIVIKCMLALYYMYFWKFNSAPTSKSNQVEKLSEAYIYVVEEDALCLHW